MPLCKLVMATGMDLQVAFDPHPLKDGFTLWNTLRVMYVAIFAVYWLYNLAHLFVDLREAAVISHFTRHRLGLSARQLKTVTWPEVARRIVDVRFCAAIAANFDRNLRMHVICLLPDSSVVGHLWFSGLELV